MRTELKCCGLAMAYTEVFGVGIYSCQHRHHPRVYVNLVTGEQVSEESLTWLTA